MQGGPTLMTYGNVWANQSVHAVGTGNARRRACGATPMLSATFLHLPGVGRRSEAKLWAQGIGSWDRLAARLRSGIPPQQLLRAGRTKTRSQLLRPALRAPEATIQTSWLDELDAAKAALARAEFTYFAERLPPVEHWRILPDALRSALYLDIETTGLSRDLHALTIVGAMYHGRFYQWVWPEAVDALSELLIDAPLVVTFNGTRFDIPFLRHHIPSLPAPRLHVDLRSVATRAGVPGGLKVVEESLGLARDENVRGIDGSQAVALWCRAVYGDRAAYRKLLAYNRADVQMLRVVGERLVRRLTDALALQTRFRRFDRSAESSGRRAASFECVRSAWQERRMTVATLEPALLRRFDRLPLVVGIDLRGKAHNPTGMASCAGVHVEHAILYDDDAILKWTEARKPDLVSIDAPLSLPRGRRSAYDDDPTRASHGIVRDAERILWSRGIRVYPALIRHMQSLTARGMALAETLRRSGIEVIESYPGAAQDVLAIPRKGVATDLLARGLRDFGFELPSELSHDELDAVTSALVGYFYLAGRHEGLGAPDENFLIVPRPDTMRWSN